MNSQNSKTSSPHRLLLNLSDKIDLKKSYKYVASSNRSINYTWKNIKKSHKNNKFKISAPKWNWTFELSDRMYSVWLLYQILALTTHGKHYKKSCKNNKFKISAPK